MALAYPYSTPATNLVNGIASLAPSDDKPGKPKQPALYRAGRNLRAGAQAIGDAYTGTVNAVDRGLGNIIGPAVDSIAGGAGDFARGVSGGPAVAPPDPLPKSAAPAGIATPPPAGGQASTDAALGTHPVNATKLKSPARVAASGGIDSGVTLPDGRKLNYGAMANGVPTFSDGSGGPGGIPATMTKQDIASLGDRLNTVPATAFTQPGAGVVADAAGLPAVSSAGQAATLVRNAQGPKFAMTPEMIAQSDNNAVASGDWRSAAGTAAHNLAVEAAAPSTYLQRTRALDDLGNLRANSAQAVQKAADNTATLRRGAQTDQNALDIANLQGQYGLADTRERALTEAALRKPDQVTLADGTVGLIQPNGAVTRALGADGKPVKVPMTKNGALTEKDINDEAIKLLPQVLGTDPTTGMIKDPNAPGGYRSPTREEIAQALPAARALLTGQAAPTAKPTLEQFLSAARSKNPGVSDAKLTDYYNKHYGS